MKRSNSSGLLLGLALLAATSVKADLVDFNFSATVSAVTDPDFTALLTPGDAVSGLITFNFSPPPVFNVSNPFLGGYSIPAGSVTGMTLSGTEAGNGPDFAAIDIRNGTGPAALVGGFERMINGLFIGMDINGFNATLSDYLALGAGDFSLTLIGQTDFGQGGIASGPVADLDVRSASFTLSQNVPDSVNAAALFCASIVALVWFRGRTD